MILNAYLIGCSDPDQWHCDDGIECATFCDGSATCPNGEDEKWCGMYLYLLYIILWYIRHQSYSVCVKRGQDSKEQ